ncbi:MAG: hypothetical protein QGH45_13145, partial [Myxococcota bacterium]|nr:hypothetical protein [Myxococcota bacterium]
MTHDALLVEIGRALVRIGKRHKMRKSLERELDKWGLTVVKTFLHDEAAQAEAGSKAGAWLAFYKAALSTRREWKTEQKQLLEPRIQELIEIVNRMAQDLANKSGKQVLVVVDDIEKGNTG